MKQFLLTLSALLLFTNCDDYSDSQYTLFPSRGAIDVCPDTHLTLTFHSVPLLGDSGKIRIIDEATHEVIDSLDLSIPAGPTTPGKYGPECDYTSIPYDYTRTSIPTNRNTRPGTPSGTAWPTSDDYQLNIIGGFTDAFHFHPVIIHDTVATIYPHNNVLEYGHTYFVFVDASVFSLPADTTTFSGIYDWRFTTRNSAPTGDTLCVDASGQGDFCTLQGALDYVPDFSETPYYIQVAPGDYEEIVYARNKRHLHIVGSGISQTRVHYANNEVFNPHPLNVKTNEWPGTFPSRRAAFMLDNCSDCTIEQITIATDLQGQAEGLLLNGERLTLREVHIIGSGDAIQANGTIYMEQCELDGGGDTFLGRGSIFAYRCHLRNDGGPFTWVRNVGQTHGDVFVECDFSTYNGNTVDLGRCPANHGRSYPDAEMVLINCRIANGRPEGWSDIGEHTARFLEFGSTDITTGKPVDVSKRHPYSRQLDAKRDALLIQNFQDPAFVLGGWNPRAH